MTFSQLISEVYVFVKSIPRAKDLLFWIIIFPILVTVVMLGIFARGGGSISFDIGIESHDNGWFNETIYKVLNSTGIFKVKYVRGDLDKAISNGTFMAGLYIPQGVSDNISSGLQVTLKIYYMEGDRSSETAAANLRGIIAGFSQNISYIGLEKASKFIPKQFMDRMRFLVEPIKVSERRLKPEVLATVGGQRAYLSISIIGIQALYAGIFSSIGMVVDRRKEGVFPVLLSSPIRSGTLFIADTISILLSIFISSIVILAVGFAMGADYSRLDAREIIVSFILIWIGMLSMIGIGLIISVVAKTPEGASALGNVIAFPVMFIGGFTIPKFLLPPVLQQFAEVFPLSRLIEAVRKMAVYNYTIHDALVYALPGIMGGLAIYMIGALLYRRIITIIAEAP